MIENNNLFNFFESKTLNKVFRRIDDSFLSLEQEAEYYKAECKKMSNKIIELQNEIYSHTQHQVGQIFKALLPDTESTDDAATAILLTKIYELSTIEEVKTFIENVRVNSLENISEKKKVKVSSIPKDKWIVHASYCCSIHGCKYGAKDCPVELGLIDQHHPCGICISTIM